MYFGRNYISLDLKLVPQREIKMPLKMYLKIDREIEMHENLGFFNLKKLYYFIAWRFRVYAVRFGKPRN